jgi:hypothetical protein
MISFAQLGLLVRARRLLSEIGGCAARLIDSTLLGSRPVAPAICSRVGLRASATIKAAHGTGDLVELRDHTRPGSGSAHLVCQRAHDRGRIHHTA